MQVNPPSNQKQAKRMTDVFKTKLDTKVLAELLDDPGTSSNGLLERMRVAYQ